MQKPPLKAKAEASAEAKAKADAKAEAKAEATAETKSEAETTTKAISTAENPIDFKHTKNKCLNLKTPQMFEPEKYISTADNTQFP